MDDINIYEEGSYDSDRNDVWGISDLDLFIEANSVLAQKAKRPFIAFIQTAGFHRPYTIPKGSKEFRPALASKKDLKKNSFSSLEEYNSLRFQDYSFGHFMNLAKSESYYSNTIFVILGDHGLPAPESNHYPKGMVDYQLTIHHTPLLFHAPGILKESTYDKVASQVDILPTLAGMVGIPYRNTTLGRDLFDKSYDDNRFTFIYSWHECPKKIGLIGKKFYYQYSPSKKGLFDYLSPNPKEDVSEKYPDIFKKMRDLCEGLYETSRYMLYNNSRQKANSSVSVK